MECELAVAVIHGIGSQQPNFAKDFIAELEQRLGTRAARVRWQAIYWADHAYWTDDDVTQPIARRICELLDAASVRGRR